MPYRRLPTTDSARLRALEKAHKKFLKLKDQNLAYSEASLTNLRSFFPRFSNALVNLEAAKINQVTKNKDFVELSRKARLYVSHFIQVMNMGILRGELKPDIRAFYELENFEGAVPPLSADADLLKWGKLVIEGDRKRIMNGGSAIYNPSIALVKVNYERFADAYHYQKNFQITTERSQNLVADLREEADQLILQMWNEIETTFGCFPDVLKRERSAEYGVIYVFRKSELENIEISKLQARLEFN